MNPPTTEGILYIAVIMSIIAVCVWWMLIYDGRE